MNNTLTIKVGVVPGAINEFVMEEGATVGQALELAGLTATGYDVRMDGVSVQLDATILSTSKVIVLVKQIKGNMEGGDNMLTVKVGVVPGAINEYVMEDGSTIKEALQLAGLDSAGYDVRIDGVSFTNMDAIIPANSKVIVLVKQIKGNAPMVKVGVVPGAINEYALESGATVAQALELAGLTATGYDVRMDGNTVTLDTVIPETAKVIVLVKQIKGNAPMVKVGVVPGAINEYALETGATVGQALELAGLSATGYDVRMDGATVTVDTVIPETAKVIVLVKQIKGNR